MRRSPSIPLAAALGVWGVAVGYPVVACLPVVARAAPASGVRGVGGVDVVPMRPPLALLVETGGYALLVTLGATLLGWGPGVLLGRSIGRRSFGPVAVALLLPLCLPAYAVFYIWWQSWPADSALHAWAIGHELVPLVKRATLVLALVAWSWPLVSWCVAGAVAAASPQPEEMLALDGAGPLARLAGRVRRDGTGLGLGALLVFLLAFDNTTCFDLAEVFSFGNELRAKDALGAAPGAVLVAALPAMGVVLAGALVVWRCLAVGPPRGAGVPRPASTASLVLAATIAGMTLLLPFALFARGLLDGADVGGFVRLYGGDAVRSLTLAAAAGVVGGILAVSLGLAWLDPRRWVRITAHVMTIGWLVLALAPGTVVGVALELAYNRRGPFPAGVTPANVVYGTPVILVLASLTRFGLVAALLGRWLATREPCSLRELRRLDGVDSVRGLLAAAGPRALAAGAASAAIVLVLALGEVPVTARVAPPGAMPLATSVLSAMHYQRPQTVLLALGLLATLALGAALLTIALGALARRGSWAVPPGVAGLLVVVVLGGCDGGDATDEPLDTRLVFGSTGTALGQFAYPRALAIDAGRGRLYVVDKTARVQRFDLDGRPQTQWRMPAKENGKPTGVSVAPDGRVFVADTHYHRVIAYDPDGNELMRFGAYGEGPGEFIYPTCVAFGPEGRLYVAEYGGNDRIQVFSAAGEYLFGFGSFGSETGAFDRPQSILFDASRTELFIADACNHRIVVVDPAGRTQRSFGGAGTAPGELHYPYGLALLDDGTLLVAEFGNNRIQRFGPAGVSRGVRGRLGANRGELRYPWDVGVADDTVFVLDSGNDRVQTIRVP